MPGTDGASAEAHGVVGEPDTEDTDPVADELDDDCDDEE